MESDSPLPYFGPEDDFTDDIPFRHMKYNTKAEKIKMMYEGDASYKSPHMLDDDIISADSVEELYEKMALYQEEFLAKVHVTNPVTYGDFRVDFSEIYTVVEEFDKSKLEATKTYIERTALYDAAFEAEKQRAIKLQAASRKRCCC